MHKHKQVVAGIAGLPFPLPSFKNKQVGNRPTLRPMRRLLDLLLLIDPGVLEHSRPLNKNWAYRVPSPLSKNKQVGNRPTLRPMRRLLDPLLLIDPGVLEHSRPLNKNRAYQVPSPLSKNKQVGNRPTLRPMRRLLITIPPINRSGRSTTFETFLRNMHLNKNFNKNRLNLNLNLNSFWASSLFFRGMSGW